MSMILFVKRPRKFARVCSKRRATFPWRNLEPPMIVASCHFVHDTSTSREVAFAKIRARIEGTAMAERELGLS